MGYYNICTYLDLSITFVCGVQERALAQGVLCVSALRLPARRSKVRQQVYRRYIFPSVVQSKTTFLTVFSIKGRKSPTAQTALGSSLPNAAPAAANPLRVKEEPGKPTNPRTSLAQKD